MFKLKLLLVAVALAFATPSFAGLVVNGTFDGNCANWALANTDGLTCDATEGNPGFTLILNNGPGVVPQGSQAIAGLVVGTLYEITLDAKSHYNCCNSVSPPGAGVAIDGNQFDFLILNSQPWTTYTFNFTYGGGSNVLVLSTQRNGTDSDGEFDNVDILALQGGAPEPATLILVGAALAGIGTFRRRR